MGDARAVDSAQNDLRLAGAGTHRAEAGHQFHIIFKPLRVCPLELLAANGLDSERHVLLRHRATLGRGDNDLAIGLIGGGGVLRMDRGGKREAG